MQGVRVGLSDVRALNSYSGCGSITVFRTPCKYWQPLECSLTSARANCEDRRLKSSLIRPIHLVRDFCISLTINTSKNQSFSSKVPLNYIDHQTTVPHVERHHSEVRSITRSSDFIDCSAHKRIRNSVLNGKTQSA
jgi:hypothetical protein